MKLLLVLLLLTASQALGEVYRWTDSRGVAHYTNRKDDIPVPYRAGAKSMEYDREPRAADLPSPENDALHAVRPERLTPRAEDKVPATSNQGQGALPKKE